MRLAYIICIAMTRKKFLPLGYSHDERKLTGNMFFTLTVVIHVILIDNLEQSLQTIKYMYTVNKFFFFWEEL